MGETARLNSFRAIVGTWDVAFSGSATSDFNAIRVWGLKGGKKYLIDCYVRCSKIKPALEWIAQFQQGLPETVSVPFRFEAQFHNDEIYGHWYIYQQNTTPGYQPAASCLKLASVS